jgi:hypothetical protein
MIVIVRIVIIMEFPCLSVAIPICHLTSACPAKPSARSGVICLPTSDICKPIRWAAATELLFGRIWQRYLAASANVSVWWFSWLRYDWRVIF